ncbi:MAG: tryptophan 2,3-dioxygenase [Caldilineaceae bacterium]|nr:tryptophan 2,3-dioxygenase [Caldilineaceae bacterium]
MSDLTTPQQALTYASYLRIDELLDLQTPRSTGPEHDELLFIIIHQVYELWFKQLLHELDYLGERLRANDLSRALHTLRRMLTILKTVVSQIDVLETMTPLEFNAFRGYLESASGFQSYQFRALEFTLGYKRRAVFLHYPKGSAGRLLLEARYVAPTLWDAFMAFLAVNGFQVPAEALNRDVTKPVIPSPAVQELLLAVYRNDPSLARVCERLVDLDEGIQEWRYRHVKMVERTIGNKRGTGGSSGVEYLHTTLKPLFPDLWVIRSQL